MTCVEFCVAEEAEPGLSLELDCGKTVWTSVSVKRPSVSAMRPPDGSEVLSVHDKLAGMDEVVFRCHEIDDSSGVIQVKEGLLRSLDTTNSLKA